MRALLQIRDLLEANKIEKAITALEHYFELFPNKEERQELKQIKTEYQKAEKEFGSGILNQVQYQKRLNWSISQLLKMVTRLFPKQQQQGQQQQSRPPTRTSPPSKSKGGIFSKVIDAFKDLLPGNPMSSAPESSVPIPRRTGTPKDTEVSNEIPSFEFPEEEEEMSAGAPPPAPPPSIPSPVPTPAPTPEVSSPFQKGKILYAIPDQMAIATPSRCRVRIAPEQISNDELFAGLKPEERETAAKESIKITSVMKVALVEAQEGDNFDIVSRNNEEQPIFPFMPTEWSFDVTPRRPGHYALLLRVTAKVQVPGYGERPFDVAVLDRAIQVNTDDAPTAKVNFSEQPIPDPDWDNEDEEAVRHALLHGRVDLAIERIVNFVQDKDTDFRDTLLLLQFRWNDNSNQLQNKLISAADWDRVNNQVRHAITQLLTELKEHYAPEVAVANLDWRTEEKNLRSRGELA
ncbi:hypothetical protein [Lewinella cohaerens]|uniref:hypothetical protein n=1 Tax=Lewinella cohaerens TaxID=70995 RepID=UPI0003652715|nr:hypothetical protein [Lewinella cohaerens]